jgi:hypothetical protein
MFFLTQRIAVRWSRNAKLVFPSAYHTINQHVTVALYASAILPSLPPSQGIQMLPIGS